MAQGEKLNDVFNVDWSGGLFTQGHLNVMCESHVYYNESGQKSKFYKNDDEHGKLHNYHENQITYDHSIAF